MSFVKVRHSSDPPEVEKLLNVLRRRKVTYVLIGSVAAEVYGVEVQPGDLDIVPDLAPSNLERLIGVLAEIEAAPLGPFGEWQVLENGEWKWIARPTTDDELAEWTPTARNIRTLDHLFVTRFGNFDVVPEIAGTYAALRPRAVLQSWRGHNLWVAHIDELLARLTIPRREKDRQRVATLREVQRRMETGIQDQ